MCLYLTQKTISKKISFKGIGIHTGKKVNLNILPAHQIQELYLRELI